MVFGKKQRKITAVIVFFTILFLLGVVVIKKISYSKYLGTEAEIVSVTTETIGDSDIHYVTYKYEVDDKYYLTKSQVLFKSFKKEGKKVIIRYNPEDPNQIEDTLLTNTGIVVSVLFLVLEVVLLISIRRTR